VEADLAGTGSVRQRSRNPSRMAGWAARDGCVGWPVTGSRWNLESAAAWGVHGKLFYSVPLFTSIRGPTCKRDFGSSSAVNGERYRISSRDNERDFVSSVVIIQKSYTNRI
jgi:hypothetical protein